MLIEIESAYGDTMLTGKTLSPETLRSAMADILNTHSERDFTAEFCRRFGYRALPYAGGYAAYVIDLDTHWVHAPSYSFPKELNGAAVLCYSDRGDYAPVYRSGGGIAHRVAYLAICAYPDDGDFYIFHCDQSLTVVADDCMPSVEACKQALAHYGITWRTPK